MANLETISQTSLNLLGTLLCSFVLIFQAVQPQEWNTPLILVWASVTAANFPHFRIRIGFDCFEMFWKLELMKSRSFDYFMLSWPLSSHLLHHRYSLTRLVTQSSFEITGKAGLMGIQIINKLSDYLCELRKYHFHYSDYVMRRWNC